ncbi:MAG: DUF3417 domain-containing protein [Parachlamydiaceae bacterium]
MDLYEQIREMALDLRSSWNHATDEIWHRINPELWELTHNPWAVLQTASKERINHLLNDEQFSAMVKKRVEICNEALSASTWFQEHHSDASLKCAAYFSMEFMLSEALPIYSGGLGNVAGDQLKAASDLGVPVVAI